MTTAPDKEELRAELARVAASLRAYLEWQEGTGASGIPRGRRPTAGATTAAPAASATNTGETTAAPTASATTAAGPASTNATNTVRATTAASPPANATKAATAPPFEPTIPDGPEWAASAPATTSAPAKSASAAAAPTRPVEKLDRAAGLVRLTTLAEEVASCTKCGLAETRNKTVFSRGNPDAKLCIVGEAPGQDEDLQGLPFVGRAGQLLDKMIGAMGLSPEKDVYVCNILKCRPPGNRRPTPDEMNTCFPYLHEQLAIVAPKVIVAMGNTAVSALLSTTIGITKLRGQWKLYRGTTLVMPTYTRRTLRPSPQQQQAKREAWEDLEPS